MSADSLFPALVLPTRIIEIAENRALDAAEMGALIKLNGYTLSLVALAVDAVGFAYIQGPGTLTGEAAATLAADTYIMLNFSEGALDLIYPAVAPSIILGTTAPVNPTPATLTTGVGNAGIAWEVDAPGSFGNAITLVTVDAAASAVTLVETSGSAITVTRAAKARMEVTADFGTGLQTVIFLFSALDINGFGIWVWEDYTCAKLAGGNYAITGGAIDYTADIVTDFPDDPLITWEDGPVTPIVTALSSSATQVLAASEASLGIPAFATLLGTGSDSFAAVSPAQSFSGGIDATATPPFFRVAGSSLYFQVDGVWHSVEGTTL